MGCRRPRPVRRGVCRATNSCASSLRLESSSIPPFMTRPDSRLPKPYRSGRLLSASIGEVRPSFCVWPSTCADAVTPESPEKTARAFAAAIDRYLSNPPPVLTSARRSNTSFENELLAAYDIAFKAGLDHAHRPQLVWAFPAGKPQVFAHTPRTPSKGVTRDAFGRRLPRDAACLGRAGATADTAPAARGTYSRPDARVWLDHLACRSRRSLSAQRSVLVGMDPFPVAVGQAAVEHARTRQRGEFDATLSRRRQNDFRSRVPSTSSFRVTACVDSFVYEAWSVRQYEPLPPFHRPASWNPARIRRVAEDVSVALKGVLPPAVGIPPHWLPIHGDYIPWNLREDDRGQLCCSIGSMRGGGHRWPIWFVTSWRIIRLPGAVLTE